MPPQRWYFERAMLLQQFDEIYKIRSQIVHRGKARLNMTERRLYSHLKLIGRRVVQRLSCWLCRNEGAFSSISYIAFGFVSALARTSTRRRSVWRQFPRHALNEEPVARCLHHGAVGEARRNAVLVHPQNAGLGRRRNFGVMRTLAHAISAADVQAPRAHKRRKAGSVTRHGGHRTSPALHVTPKTRSRSRCRILHHGTLPRWERVLHPETTMKASPYRHN
jgi:hypothetical protein